MHPLLFAGVRAYPASIVLAFIVGMLTVGASARRAGLSVPTVVWAALLFVALPGLIGTKLYAILERGGHVYPLTWELQNGYRYPGSLFGIALGLALIGRLSARRMSGAALADVIAPAVLLAMTTSRIGCFLEGCCYGTPSHLPWAVRFPVASQPWNSHVAHGLLSSNAPTSLPVHPLQLYFSLLALLVGCVLLYIQGRKAYDGQVVLLYLVLHEPAKFLLEFLRDGPLPHIQLPSLGFALLGGSVLLARAVITRKVADDHRTLIGRAEGTGISLPGN